MLRPGLALLGLALLTTTALLAAPTSVELANPSCHGGASDDGLPAGCGVLRRQ